MNFPMSEPIYRFFYWLMNTPGLGGLVVVTIVVTALTIFVLTLYCIACGAKTEEVETYSYPTTALHHHSQEGAQ